MRRHTLLCLTLTLSIGCLEPEGMTGPGRVPMGSPSFTVTIGNAVLLGTSCAGDARAVNASGQIAGWTGVTGCLTHAMRWSASSGLQDLGTLGGFNSLAWGINAAGDVSGVSELASGDAHAFVWKTATGMVDLGTLGGSYSAAQDINDNGVAAGSSLDAADNMHAVIWAANGAIQDLGALSGTASCEALALNNVGQVVGDCDAQPFVWSAGSGMQAIPLPTGTSGGAAWSVNDAGQVAGYFMTSAFMHAFRWSLAQGFQDLGVLAGTQSQALGINKFGYVVGKSKAANGQDHAFIWTPWDGMVDLGVPAGQTQAIANAISDDGHVAGFTPTSAVMWTVQVTPPNRPPVVSMGGPYVGSEGSAVTLALTASDPDGDALTLSWNLGDGTTGSGLPPATHTYADNGTYTVTFTADDGKGGSDTQSTSVTVANVVPQVGATSGPPDPVPVGATVAVTAAFTDLGTADTHTATFNWGDGTTGAGTVTETNGSGSVSATHEYSVAGVYSVAVTVTDDDNGAGSGSFNWVVVFEPSVRHVTGGGWVESPAGAYNANPTLVGRVTFGFVSKFEPGAPAPTGSTEFQFKAAGVNFKSSSYESLVVNGARAQFRGVGKVNGAGAYAFLVSVIDGETSGGGGTDRFRIKIWDATGVIYDSQPGSSDGSDPTTALGGGNIMIHRGWQ